MIHIMKHSQYVVLVRNCIFFNLGYTRAKASNNNEDHLCPHHNNVMQFLEVSKNCQVTWLEPSTFWKKSYLNFALNVLFLWKNLRARSYLKIIDVARGVAQRGGPVGPGTPQLKCHQWHKFDKKTLFLHFLFLLASLRTTVHAYKSN